MCIRDRYEEGLDDKTVNGAVNAIANADTLIIAGTSLTVYPAAGMVRYFKGNKPVSYTHLDVYKRQILA